MRERRPPLGTRTGILIGFITGVIASIIAGLTIETVHLIGQLLYNEETRSQIIKLIWLVLKIIFG
ncbi:MAG: hypothetical protein JW924_00675 [Fusobacteriaceae bacterium]|nr:hypothetical protein [Fusobacteriaceae bacterium]